MRTIFGAMTVGLACMVGLTWAGEQPKGVDPTPLTTHRFPFTQVERAFHMMETKEDNIVKPLITF